MTRHPVRVPQIHDDHPRTDGARPLFAVLAGALIALATTTSAHGGHDADAPPLHGVDAFAAAEVAVVAGGSQLVGFGTVTDGRLDLQLRNDTRGFVTLVVIVSAEIGAVVDAFVTADGRVTVLVDTSFEPLEGFLEPFGAQHVERRVVPSLEATALASWASRLSGVVTLRADPSDAATEAALAADADPVHAHVHTDVGVSATGSAHAAAGAPVPAGTGALQSGAAAGLGVGLGAGLSLGGGH